MNISHVVATSNNGVIGLDGKMPWHIADDLKRFKEVTMGGCMIMGRKTFDSIGRLLPGRHTVVVSRQKDLKIPGAQVCASVEEAIAYCKKARQEWGDEVFIVGGGEIYRQSFPEVSRVYLTLIDETVDGDTTYPLEQLKGFQESERRDFHEPLNFSFLTLDRQS